MVAFHILAGLVALAAGAIAMGARKGSTLHRCSGLVFVVAMLVMTSSAVLIAGWLRPNRLNVVAGLVTFYLVCSGVLTVMRPVERARGPIAGLMLLAFAAGAYAISLGVESIDVGRVDGMPSPPFFMFGVVGLLGALLDARLLRAGRIEGAARLARHLWRMSFAMWIATASFFLGQAKFFPAPLRESGLLAIPVLFVLGFLVYWLVKVRRQGSRPRVAASASALRSPP